MKRAMCVLRTPKDDIYEKTYVLAEQVDEVLICDCCAQNCKSMFQKELPCKRVYYIWFGETRDLDEVMEWALSENSVDWHAEDFVMIAEQESPMRKGSVEKLAEAYREQAYGGRKTIPFPKSNVSMLFTTYRGLEYIKNERKLAGLTVGKIYRMLLKNGIPCTCTA